MATAASVKDQLKTSQSQGVATADEPPTIRKLIEDPLMQAEIEKALPTAMTPKRFTRLLLTAVNSNPLLLQCNPRSLLASGMQCAQLGLEPNTPLGHCWLLPFRNHKKNIVEVQFILGYRGIIDLAHRSDHILSVEARTVHEHDAFDYQFGLNEKLDHVPVLTDPGEPIAYYGIARFTGGGHYWVVLSPATIEEHRARSSSPNSPAWKDDYDAMARKTAVRVMAPYLPLSAVAAEGIAADESTPVWEHFTGADDVLNVDARDGEAPAEDEPQVDRCAECGEVDGGHRDDCSMKGTK